MRQFMFEMTIKEPDSETIKRTNSIGELLTEMARRIDRTGAAGPPRYSGAGGSIEIGVKDGPQIKIQVLANA